MSAREKLEAEILPTEWKMLAMHQRRGALYMVDPAISLLDVAIAIAEDRKAEVEAWVSAAQLAHPAAEDVEVWCSEEGTLFRSVIVQPFVLAQRDQSG